MNKWIETFDGKKIKQICGGKIYIISSNADTVIPLFCRCCELPMRTIDDGLAFRKSGVCNKCDEKWTNRTGNVWPEGPDKSSGEWKEYLHVRSLLEKPELNFD